MTQGLQPKEEFRCTAHCFSERTGTGKSLIFKQVEIYCPKWQGFVRTSHFTWPVNILWTRFNQFEKPWSYSLPSRGWPVQHIWLCLFWLQAELVLLLKPNFKSLNSGRDWNKWPPLLVPIHFLDVKTAAFILKFLGIPHGFVTNKSSLSHRYCTIYWFVSIRVMWWSYDV